MVGRLILFIGLTCGWCTARGGSYLAPDLQRGIIVSSRAEVGAVRRGGTLSVSQSVRQLGTSTQPHQLPVQSFCYTD